MMFFSCMLFNVNAETPAQKKLKTETSTAAQKAGSGVSTYKDAKEITKPVVKAAKEVSKEVKEAVKNK